MEEKQIRRCANHCTLESCKAQEWSRARLGVNGVVGLDNPAGRISRCGQATGFDVGCVGCHPHPMHVHWKPSRTEKIRPRRQKQGKWINRCIPQKFTHAVEHTLGSPLMSADMNRRRRTSRYSTKDEPEDTERRELRPECRHKALILTTHVKSCTRRRHYRRGSYVPVKLVRRQPARSTSTVRDRVRHRVADICVATSRPVINA